MEEDTSNQESPLEKSTVNIQEACWKLFKILSDLYSKLGLTNLGFDKYI